MMNDLPDEFERLRNRLEALERRVDTLEHPLAADWPHPLAEVESALVAASAAVEPPAQPGNLFPVLGKALLGIAGAYVLRAVEETSAFPRLIVAAAGIAYAFLWLVWAARLRGGPRSTSSIYAGTSALILAPMLWELTLRFNVLPAAAAAVVVCVFGLTAFALAAFTPRDLKPVVRVACAAAAALALALAIASHVLLPFIVVLLILGAVCEFVPGCDRVPEVCALVALAADAAIWILIYVYFAGQTGHEGYPALSRGALLAPGIAVFALYAASVGVKTVLRARPIAVFAIIQAVLAFLLASVSLADFGQPAGLAILGVACLALSPVCYVMVFTVFARAPDRRNTTVFAGWGAALLLAGSFLCLPPVILIPLLGAAALAAMGLSRRERWTVFEFYGMLFLLAAAAASGLLTFLASALVGTPSGAPAVGVWLIAMCAVLCYALVQQREAERWIPQALRLGFAALAAGAVTALLVDGLIALVSLRVMPAAHHLALIRTVTLCAAALALVSGGAHRQRRELTRLGYAAIALVAVKLITEDLRHGHLAYIAAAIFLLAFTLIAAPRVARARQKA
ncbi:MAG: hypothetical protein P4K93_07140 [Terracidiphilus sp.]|nr:hypothetical protein [Terracidiphilus sp.]MDR3797910.1 hypothetical protein [Terracidiphilus sp.]